MPHFMIVLIPYINLLNLSWIIKCLFLRNMEPLKLQYKGCSGELPQDMFGVKLANIFFQIHLYL